MLLAAGHGTAGPAHAPTRLPPPAILQPAWAVGVLFLTNVFAFPFMALRAAPEPQQLEGQPGKLEGQRQRRPAPPGSQAVPGWARGVGAAGGALGVLCIAWAFAGRPELGGDLAARSAFFAETAGSNRVRATGTYCQHIN